MPTPSDVLAYYRAALSALRFVEQRRPTGRRFGSEADARWAALEGDLTAADRIDLLIRDANAEWPGAVGARVVFRMNDVAEDDPFGPTWEPLGGVDGEELWRAALTEPPPASLGAALDAVASAWSVKLSPASLGPISPTDRLLVAGPSAIASTIATFAESSDLDIRRQVVFFATPAAARQLAALAALFLDINDPVRVDAADKESASDLGERRAIVSDDAHPADRRWVISLAEQR